MVSLIPSYHFTLNRITPRNVIIVDMYVAWDKSRCLTAHGKNDFAEM